MTCPLAKIRVIDLTSRVSGPFCTMVPGVIEGISGGARLTGQKFRFTAPPSTVITVPLT